MKRLVSGLTMMLVLAVLVGSCGKKKSEAVEKVNATEHITEGSESEAEVHDHGYEMAMSAYQCPMKCEGDRKYEEEGACPECKMDLKKVELKKEEVSGQDTGTK